MTLPQPATVERRQRKPAANRRRIRIRPCRARDISSVLELWSRAAAGPSVTDNAAAVRLRLRRDRRLFLLAWDETRLVGSLIGGWDGWRASMARLAVDPAYRRRGVARLLAERVEKELRSLGATRVGCVVLAENRPARAFWKDSNYRLDTEVVRYVKDLR